MDVFFDWRWCLIRKTYSYLGQSQWWYKKDFDSDIVYNKDVLKAKIKSHGDKVTDDEKIPKVDPNHTCLAVISLDSPLKKDDNNYPQTFLKECKCTEKKVIRHISDNLSDFSSSSLYDEE